MEIEKKDINPIALRMMDFVEAHGGPPIVGRKIGHKPTLFYHFQSGRSTPSADTLAVMAKAYDDFDTLYILTGIPSSARLPQLGGNKEGSPVAMADLSNQIDWKRQAEKLEAKVEQLEQKNDRLTMALLGSTHPELFTDKEGVKIPSSSHTAGEQVEIGLGQTERVTKPNQTGHDGVRYFDLREAVPMPPHFYK